MIWSLIFRVIGNPLGVALIGAAAAFGAFHGGKMIGRAEGVAEQKAAQAEADARQGAAIRERVRDALQELGADASDDDVDRILRGLAGQ